NGVKTAGKDGTCPQSPSCPEVIVPPRGPSGVTPNIAIDKDAVYTANRADGHITKVDLKTLTAIVLAAEPNAFGVTVDDAWVYWTTYSADGEIWRGKKDGSSSELLASGQNWPYAVVVDGASIFWVNRGTQTDASNDFHDLRDGAVMRLSK